MVRAAVNEVAGGVVAAFLLSSGAIPAVAWAAPAPSLRDYLFGDRVSPGGMPSPPPVARYRLDVGESFVVDRVGRDEALLKFDGGDEVWALKGVNAAHGDMVFKNDLGEPVLRATRWGGVTLFTPSRPEGAAAALEGGALALRSGGQIGPQALTAVVAQCSIRAGRAAGHLIAFDAQGVPAAFDWLFADAAQLAADAFVRVAQDGRRTMLARFSEVRLSPGHTPAVVASGTMVSITVAPDRGVAGRPSSRRIQTAMTRR